MNLSKKTLTRLLDADFRKRVLTKAKRLDEKKSMGIFQAAKYFVDLQILQRMQGHENDKRAGWGFPQLNILCAVKRDGSVEKKLFEFKTVNHFLKDKDGDSAVKVVACILAIWAENDKDVESFDYEKIDAELVKLDEEASKIKAKEQQIDATGKKIKELVEPEFEKIAGLEYGEACKRAQVVTTEVLDKMKAENEIAQYAMSFMRNCKMTIDQGMLFVDISFKLEENDNWTVLACCVNSKREGDGNNA